MNKYQINPVSTRISSSVRFHITHGCTIDFNIVTNIFQLQFFDELNKRILEYYFDFGRIMFDLRCCRGLSSRSNILVLSGPNWRLRWTNCYNGLDKKKVENDIKLNSIARDGSVTSEYDWFTFNKYFRILKKAAGKTVRIIGL